MTLADIEYVVLRLARRFIFSDSFLLRFGGCVPHYRANLNQTSPAELADRYARLCGMSGAPIQGTVLEVGSGMTDSVGYELLARGADRFWGYEPFVKFDAKMDASLLEQSKKAHPAINPSKATRISSLGGIAPGSVDLVLSNSVLEHVKDMDDLTNSLRPLLSKGARQIHIVDYRDHFFKYPFGFLKYSRHAWDRYLNPGDLWRYRVRDHIECFRKAGFKAEMIERVIDMDAYNMVAARVHADFKGYTAEENATTSATIVVETM